MTYIQWRDELNAYLGAMPADEKERIFSYFSEMYADKREAGMSERDIVAEFGAPYDAAQRILSEESNKNYGRPRSADPPQTYEKSGETKKSKSVNAGGVVLLVILCVVCFGPFVGLLSAAFGITVGFITAPIGIIVCGFCTIGAAIGGMVAGYVAPNVILLGAGIAAVGIGLILMPLFYKIVCWIWHLLKKLFSGIKSLCEKEI